MIWGFVLKFVLVVGIVVTFGVARHYLKMEDDNRLEEEIEYMIEDETGLDIDLTPESPEYVD